MWAACRVLATLTTGVCLLAAFVDVIAICARAIAATVVVFRSELLLWVVGEGSIGRDEKKAVLHRSRRTRGESSQPRKQQHKLCRQGGLQVEVMKASRQVFQELERCLWQLEPGLWLLKCLW